MSRSSLWLSLATLLAACGVRAVPPPPTPAAKVVADGPAQLPPWLRPIVRGQMQRHREYVNELRWTATSLEFDRTGALARRIVEEVQCGRPGEGTPSLVGVVPAGYLDLQEKLRERAYRLVEAAASGNSHRVTGAYRAMLDACTHCHDVYGAGAAVELPLLSERGSD